MPSDEEHASGLHRFRPTLTTLVPEGWFAKESVQVFSDEAGGHVAASVDLLALDTTLEGYAELYGKVLTRQFPGYQELGLEPVTLRSGARALLRRFRWGAEEGRTLTQLQLYALEQGRGVVGTATAGGESFGRLEPLLRQILLGLGVPRAGASPPVGWLDDGPRRGTYLALERGELTAAPAPTHAGEGGAEPPPEGSWSRSREAWKAVREGL